MAKKEVYVTSLQERQLAACAKLMAEETLIPLTIVEGEEPLERSRIYGPFDIEVIGWIMKMGALVRMGWDADGREYAEY